MQKFTPFWHKNVKNRVGFWGSAPDPAGGAYDAPQTPSREGLLAFGNRSFAPSALNPPLAPPQQKKTPPYPPPNKNPRPVSPPKHKILEPPLGEEFAKVRGLGRLQGLVG